MAFSVCGYSNVHLVRRCSTSGGRALEGEEAVGEEARGEGEGRGGGEKEIMLHNSLAPPPLLSVHGHTRGAAALNFNIHN